MAERFPFGPSTRPDPPFPLINSHPFGSARSRPRREAAQRTLDGEDRSGTIRGEGKEIRADRASEPVHTWAQLLILELCDS